MSSAVNLPDSRQLTHLELSRIEIRIATLARESFNNRQIVSVGKGPELLAFNPRFVQMNGYQLAISQIVALAGLPTQEIVMKQPGIKTDWSRRQWLTGSLGFAGAGITSRVLGTGDLPQQETEIPGPDYKVTSGRAKQSVMAWCFHPMPMETLIPACAKMGLVAMEGIDPKFYPLMKQHGLNVSLCSSHGFKVGPFDKANHEICEQKLRAAIDLAVQWNCPGVITFTGMCAAGISDQQGSKNCVELWKRVTDYAEEKQIDLALER